MKHLAETYLAELSSDSVVTKERRRYLICDFLDFLAARGISLAQCRREHFDEYHQSLFWRPVPGKGLWSVNTVDQALRMVRAFLRWALARGHIETDITVGLAWPRPPQPSQRSLSRLEIQKLFTLPDLATPAGLRDQALLEMLYNHQLSRQQCELLELQDADRYEEKSLLHYLSHSRPKMAQEKETALFVNLRGGRLSNESMRVLLKAYAQSLGYTNLAARDLHRAAREHDQKLHSARFHSP